MKELQLLPYQVQGIDFLTSVRYIENGISVYGGLLRDEQGLGKTVQAIKAVEKLFKDKVIHNVLIICPAIMRRTWFNEIKNWLNYTPDLLDSTSDKLSKNHVIHIVSYEYVAKNYRSTSCSCIDGVIVDESHKIKNPKAVRTKAVMYVLRAAKARILLTGTPIMKGVDDLYTQLVPFFPVEAGKKALGRSIWDFRNKFMFSKTTRFGVEYYGCHNPETLKRLLNSVSLRRTKTSVNLTLPKLFHEKVYVKISEKLRLASLQFAECVLASINSERKLTVSESSCVSCIRKDLGLSKVKITVDYVLDKLKEESEPCCAKSKLVVFAYHNDVVDTITKALQDKGIKTGKITGATTAKQKDVLIEEFQNTTVDSSVQVLVCNIIAAGVGITLTAAHTEVFAELDWTPANLAQAEARCHRLGQKSDVHVVFILAEDSLDTRIVEALMEKISLVKEITHEENTGRN